MCGGLIGDLFFRRCCDVNDPAPAASTFVVRLWPEPSVTEEGGFEWRGEIRHVTTGETRYFRRLSGLLAVLTEFGIDESIATPHRN